MGNNTTIKNIFYIFFLSFLIIAFFSCSSTKKAPPSKQKNTTTTTTTQKEKPVEKIEEKPVKPAPAEEKKVSEAVYNKTFSDIQDLVTKLNKIISDSNFDAWKKYLTQDYINYYSSPANLRQISENPILKKHNITLRSLKDYFTYVVVPSRSNATLDSISFVDDNHIKAYMLDGDILVILYNLLKSNNSWKIDK